MGFKLTIHPLIVRGYTRQVGCIAEVYHFQKTALKNVVQVIRTWTSLHHNTPGLGYKDQGADMGERQVQMSSYLLSIREEEKGYTLRITHRYADMWLVHRLQEFLVDWFKASADIEDKRIGHTVMEPDMREWSFLGNLEAADIQMYEEGWDLELGSLDRLFNKCMVLGAKGLGIYMHDGELRLYMRL